MTVCWSGSIPRSRSRVMAASARGWLLMTRKILRRASGSPGTQWVVRTGSGVFYAQDTGNPRFDMARNAAGRRRDGATATQLDLNWNSPFRGLESPTALIVTPFVLANVYNRRTPYSKIGRA